MINNKVKTTSTKSNRSWKKVDYVKIVFKELKIKMLVGNTHHFVYLLTKCKELKYF